jgi:hypothetical protein
MFYIPVFNTTKQKQVKNFCFQLKINSIIDQRCSYMKKNCSTVANFLAACIQIHQIVDNKTSQKITTVKMCEL